MLFSHRGERFREVEMISFGERPHTSDGGRPESAMDGPFDPPAAFEIRRILVAAGAVRIADGAMYVAELLATRWGAAVEPLASTSPEEIAERALSTDADLVLIGLGRRRISDQTPDDETALEVVRLTSAPVLAVPPRVRTLPTTAVVAIDFGEASIRAAQAALLVMDRPATMHLVHIDTTYEPLPGEVIGPSARYAAGFQAMFDLVERELRQPADVAFERVVVPLGDPVAELLGYASANAVELIVAGNNSKTLRERLRLGSVSTGLVRSAQCAVLVAAGDRIPR